RSGGAGELFTLTPGTGLEYEPARRRVPLMIGTWRPRMAALAGEVADEVKIGGCANPEMVQLMREWIGNHEVGIVVGAVTVVDEDGDAARAHAAAEVAMYLEIVGRLDPTLGPGPPPLEKFVLAGTPGRGRSAGAKPSRRGREARRVRNTAGTLDRPRRRASL
ncbi:MAG: LLM class flavin-dependent oxidoreductase, partial [Gaiellaceae bacterium]